MTLNSFKHWYRYHHQGRAITIVKRYNAQQGIVAIPVLATGSPREGFLEPFTITSVPASGDGTGTGEIKADNFFNGDEKDLGSSGDEKDLGSGGLQLIYVYCGMSLAQAIQYQQNPPMTSLHPGVKGTSKTLPTTWMAASRWLETKGISYTKKHRANLDPSSLIIGDGSRRMKGVIHNYYQLTFRAAKDVIGTEAIKGTIKEEELVNVPHLYDESQNAYVALIKTYGYVKKSSSIVKLLNKALISRDKGSCIDYATAFLERPVYDIDMTMIDWSKPVQGIDIVRACHI